VTIDRLQVHSLAATRVSAKVSLDGGKLQISQLNADFLGGKHRGEWEADFGETPVVCRGSGRLTAVSLERLADVIKDEGIAGSAGAAYEVKGTCPADVWKSAEGTLQFASKEDAEPFEVTRFAGQARLHGGEIEMKDARLDSTGGAFQVSGTASLKGELDLKLARAGEVNAAQGHMISGTLAEPRVVSVSGAEVQARLKTPAK
jgi:autotransporter translocation and assembly factor TamB